MLIKVCGMTDTEEIERLDQSGMATMMGFIFYSGSKRYIPETLHTLVHTKKVGVFVNASEEEILEKISKNLLDIVQLHGKESPALCKSIRKHAQVIKAFGINSSFNLDSVGDYEGVADLFLFDTATSDHGGSGKTFNWTLLDEYRGTTPFLLSGGIGKDQLNPLLHFNHPKFAGIDINSKFETAPGRKNITEIEAFINQLKNKKHVQSR